VQRPPSWGKKEKREGMKEGKKRKRKERRNDKARGQ
jgi:hypothetical protein